MASMTASRFAVLKIEDDSDQEREKSARKKAAEEEKNKKKLTKKKKRNKPAETKDPELQSMAFGLPKPKQQAKQQQLQQQQQQKGQGSESPKKATEAERSDWERRDQALIDEAFERDLQQAMLMSRVDLERAAAAPEAETNGHEAPKQKTKKTKASVLSVDQLQTLSTSQIDRGDYQSLQPPAGPSSASAAAAAAAAAAADAGGDFFDQVEKKTREAVHREKVIESIRQQPPPSAAAASASASELQLRLATAESQLEQLSGELEHTRDELRLAKGRTKRVLSVLTQSETKEKVQLIVSLEKAQAAKETADKERAEMSAQVTSLLAQLEQERSRVHALTVQLKRAQGNKRRGHSENDAADPVD